MTPKRVRSRSIESVNFLNQVHVVQLYVRAAAWQKSKKVDQSNRKLLNKRGHTLIIAFDTPSCVTVRDVAVGLTQRYLENTKSPLSPHLFSATTVKIMNLR